VLSSPCAEQMFSATDTTFVWVVVIGSWATVLEMYRERPAVLGQTTSSSTSASSRGIVIIASWPVGNWRRRHPASVGGRALGANRWATKRCMSETKNPPLVHSICVRGVADTIAEFFR